MLIMFIVMLIFMSISLLFMDHAWKKEELSFMQNWRSHAIVDIQNPMHNLRGSFLFWWIIKLLF
jgi:hypothetical protein